MAKPDKPLFSFGARGTIADTLTFQKRGQQTIVREKPIPKDPYSLAQAYQRWDYRDYAYLWTLLSNSEKQVYRTKASRYHITGFSQWMRENLKALTGLAARWHLDEKAGAVVYDSSKNNNNGTIFGPSPASGLIAGAYSFDGINDYINCGLLPTLDVDHFTITGFAHLTDLAADRAIMGSTIAGAPANPEGPQARFSSDGTNRLAVGASFGIFFWSNNNFAVPLQWIHFAFSYDRHFGRFFRNGVPWGITAQTAPIGNYNGDLLIGKDTWNFKMKGKLDQLTYHNRALDATEIKRHSERRYPA